MSQNYLNFNEIDPQNKNQIQAMAKYKFLSKKMQKELLARFFKYV